jgi:hypothetical protein
MATNPTPNNFINTVDFIEIRNPQFVCAINAKATRLWVRSREHVGKRVENIGKRVCCRVDPSYTVVVIRQAISGKPDRC